MWQRTLSFLLPERFQDENRDGHHESVLAIDLGAASGCHRLELSVRFGSSLASWQLDLGDSPTNDGYGGDGGSTGNNAELTLSAGELRLYSNLVPTASGPAVEQLLETSAMDWSNRELQIEIRRQEVHLRTRPRAGAPQFEQVVRSLVRHVLFAIEGEPDPLTPGLPESGDRSLYLGLNRVIQDRHGKASDGRLGRGVTEAVLRLLP